MNKSKRTRKPYPWRCTNCLQDAVYAGSIDYEVDLNYHGKTYHIRLNALKTPRCRNCGTPRLDDNANAKITRELIRQAGLLTPRQIRNDRERAGLTQAEYAAKLRVSESTVQRWEEGSQIRWDNEFLRDLMGCAEAMNPVIEVACGKRISPNGRVRKLYARF